MPFRLPVYDFYVLQNRDTLYAGYDEDNMRTVENQLAALLSFGKPGILEGWEITVMNWPSSDVMSWAAGNDVLDAQIIEEQLALINGYDLDQDSLMGQKYKNLGLVRHLATKHDLSGAGDDDQNELYDPVDREIGFLRAATTANIALDYNTTTIDGVNLDQRDLVLVKDQTDKTQNGVYLVNLNPLEDLGEGAGNWARAYNLNADEKFLSGLVVRTGPEGTTQSYQVYQLAANLDEDGEAIPYDMGVTEMNWVDVWSQCIRVTPGYGIVGTFAASTICDDDDPMIGTFYFRYQGPGFYYVWAESTLFLVSDQECTITAPTDQDSDYDLTHTAVYLGTVEVTEDAAHNDNAIILSIFDEDRRNQLKNLEGAQREIIRKAFLHHVHAGGYNNPSKIKLDTQVILTGEAPEGSPIFKLYDVNGKPFSGSPSNYGAPEVRLNNATLPSTSYEIRYTNPWRVYLKNSLPAGSVLQVIMSLAPQKTLKLKTIPSGNINDAVLYLTDGTMLEDEYGNEYEKIYTWDPAFWISEVILTDSVTNIEITPSENSYTLVPSTGNIIFLELPSGTFNNSSLSVVLTKTGIEVTGKLSGKRIGAIDASLFNQGELRRNRIVNLDHVGQVRLHDLAELRPSLRLLSLGDKYTYYPELTDSTLQFNTDVNQIVNSQNINAGKITLCTKRGMMVTTNYSIATLNNIWKPDVGNIVQLKDALLPSDPDANELHTSFIRTQEGKVYKSLDLGSSWKYVPVPAVQEPGSPPETPEVTAMFASLDKIDSITSSGLKQPTWFTWLLVGTDHHSVLSRRVVEGTDLTIPNPKTAAEIFFDEDGLPVNSITNPGDVGKIHAICQVIAINKSFDPDTNVQTDTVVRTTLVGADTGFYIDNHRYSTDIVKGFLVIPDNDVIWWTDHEVFITHTAGLTVDQATGNQTWTLPFSGQEEAPIATVVAATTLGDPEDPESGNLPLGGLMEVDGVSVQEGELVLVKNQIDPQENGIYEASEFGWTRLDHLTLVGDATPADRYLPNDWVQVTGGVVNEASAWYLPGLNSETYVFGEDDIQWSIRSLKILSKPSQFIRGVTKRGAFNQYFVYADNAMQLIIDTTEDYNVPYSRDLIWFPEQGEAQHLVMSSGQALVASNRGLWRSTSDLLEEPIGDQPWTRIRSEFTSSGPTPVVYDEHTLEVIENWEKYPDYQSFVLDDDFDATVYENLIYERDFTHYYVNPWKTPYPTQLDPLIEASADVFVYINGQISDVAYMLYPELGLIQFTQSLTKDDIVTVSIIRKGAYITNVGDVPHLEIPNNYLVTTSSSTTLSRALAPTDSVVVVDDPQAIPVTATLLEIRSATNAAIKEKLTVRIDPVTREISIPYARSTQITYPVGSGLYLVANGSEFGLQDLVIQYEANQPYNFNSLSGANQIQLGIEAAKNMDAPEFTGNFQNTDRGPKNAIFFDFEEDETDPKASSASFIIGQEPSLNDSASQPIAVYNLSGLTVGGSGMLAGTDQGVWACNTTFWKKQSALGGASRTYYLTSTTAGTDQGLFRQSDGEWVADLTFPQTIFDYLPKQIWSTDAANPTYFEAYGKDDGLAFIYYPSTEDPTDFTSDHFDPLDLKRIYGLWTNLFFRISFDSQGNMIQTPHRALYLCTEIGLYAVTLGSRPGEFVSLLGGREMFGDRIPMKTHALPSGGTEQVPVKFYKIFRFLPSPPSSKDPIPIILLSNDGIFKVTNWRWCDPTDVSTLNFYPDSHHLAGVSCYCYATKVTGDGVTVPAVSKAFVGTDRGVYRSFNNGASWEVCERINGGLTTVFDIKTTSADNDLGYILVAATQYGLFYSDDDGDTWYRPTVSNLAEFDYNISSARHFNEPSALSQGGFLGQTFTITDEAGGTPEMLKISMYLSLTEDDGEIQDYELSLSNTLQASIYEVDANGLPTGSPISQDTLPDGSFPPDSLTASDVINPGYYSLFVPITSGLSVDTTYALVVEELVTPGGSPIFRWHASSKSTPYSGGKAISGGVTGAAWAEIEDTDFFFRTYFALPEEPTITRVDADFTENYKNGLLLNDDDELTTDFKFAIALCLDDSHSTLWSDPELNRGAALLDLITQISTRSSINWSQIVGSDLYGTTYTDMWVYGTKIVERTLNGYTTNLTTLDTLLGSLYQKGNLSEIYDAVSIAISTLSPQSIIEAIITTDETDTAKNVENLVNYLEDQSILRLTEIQNWFAEQVSPSDWDGLSSTIHNYSDVSSYVVTRWANSFTPLGFVAADGDTTTSASPSTVGLQAQTVWNDNGAPIMTFGLGSSQLESGLRTLANLSGGRHFFINESPDDWDSIASSFMHGGDNSLFVGSWSQLYDFDDPTFIQYVSTSYDVPVASGSDPDNVEAACLVEYRYTKDRLNWSEWTELSNATSSNINELVFGLEYRITLTDGWDAFAGGAALKPTVSELFYMKVVPSVQYLITYPYDIEGMFFEHLMSATVDLPKSARAQWGVGRGLSSDFNDFELIINNRRSCLANRQQSILFTTAAEKIGVRTRTSDDQTFVAYDLESDAVIRWSTTDEVTVYVNGREISDENYSLNGGSGIVLFNLEQVPGITVTLDIVTPETIYTAIGEPASTSDGRTYYAQNGRWPGDATAIVLLNGNIVRGGYWASPESGTITFAVEKERTDIVTVYIQHANQFRVGVALYNYGVDPITPTNFGMYYSTRNNAGIINQYYNTQPPSIANNKVTLSPSPCSINQRLQVTYTFNSIEGSVETGTETTWWRKVRDSEDIGDFVVTDGDYIQITAENGLPEYNNRFVERSVDVGGTTFEDGDMVYVIVYPSDGFTTGTGVRSNIVTFGTNEVPYVSNLLAYNQNRVGVWSPPHVPEPSTDPNYQADPDYYQIKAGLPIDALYTFNGSDNQSIVTWFEKASLGDAFYVGVTIPAGRTIQGQVLYFTVLPYDGEIYGNLQISESIAIN